MILDDVIKLLRWCEIKILLSEHQSNALFKEGEIWWGEVGMRVILNQIKSMDKKRLVKRVGTLDMEAFEKVQDAFWDFYHAS
jgi:hypothetical protein